MTNSTATTTRATVEDFTAIVAGRVDAARCAAGMSVMSLSTATGIPRTTLARQLAGQSQFMINGLASIAIHLDVSISEWLDDLPTPVAECRIATKHDAIEAVYTIADHLGVDLSDEIAALNA
jgi:hypothetical protein